MRTRHLVIGAVLLSVLLVEFGVTREISLVGRAGGSTGSTSVRSSPSAKASPSRAPVYDVAHLLNPTGKFYGASLYPAPTDPTSVQRWTQLTGKQANVLALFESFDDGFAASQVRSAYQQGALTLVRWEPYKAPLADIAAGKYDSYITTFAQAVRQLNLPIGLTFAHEMNGNWYPWGTKTTKAADYVAAWRHVHDLFQAADAKNVIWVWTPNVINPVPSIALAPLYPGDAYVDWVGLDGYYTHRGQHTYSGLFGPTISKVHAFTQKPFIIVETAAEPGSQRPAWIKDLVTGVENDRQMLGFVWFDMTGSANWKIDDDSAATAEFRKITGDPRLGFVVK